MVQTVEFEGFCRRDEDGLPIFCYTADLGEREDLKGKFDVQFAAVKANGDAQFALITQPGGTWTFEYTDEVGQLLADLIRHESFIAAIDYEGRGWDVPGGYMYVPMGRDFGGSFDLIQERDLSTDDVIALKKIKDALDGASRYEEY